MEIGNLAVISTLLELGANSSAEDRMVFYNLRPTGEVKYMLQHFIRERIIDANEAMIWYASKISSKEHLCAFSIALREGADPNVYVSDTGIAGNIHILAFLLSTRRSPDVNEPLLDLAAEVLILAGASGELPVYDRQHLIPENALRDTGPTLLEWILAQELDPNNILVSTPSMNAALLTGRIDLVLLDHLELTEEQATTIIESRANSQVYIIGDLEVKITDYFPRPVRKIGVDYELLYTSVQEYDPITFQHYVNHGLKVSYPLVNDLLLKILSVRSVRPLFEVIGNLLATTVSNGYDIDIDQKTLLNAAGKDIYDAILALHEIPRLKRYCSSGSKYKEKLPKELKDTMSLLGVIDLSDPAKICTILSTIFLSDSESLYVGLTNKQKLSVLSQYGYPSELIHYNQIVLDIENLSNFTTDPYDYHSDYIVFYRDADGVLSAWDSTSFSFILKTKLNPLNQEPLPEEILYEIASKLKKITERQENPNNPMMWTDFISKIMTGGIDTAQSQSQLELMMTDLGIVRDISFMTAKQLSEIACGPVCIYNIDELTNSHALITFSYIYNHYKDLANTTLKSRLLESIRKKDVVQRTWEPISYVPSTRTPIITQIETITP